jgi:hypothetical protein
VKFFLLFFVALLTACSGLVVPADFAKLKADQIEAMATLDNGLTVDCTVLPGLAGIGAARYIRVRQDAPSAGTIKIDSTCSMELKQ